MRSYFPAFDEYKWCCKSDIIVEGLPWARKFVDDTIIWADNEEDLVIRTWTVLEQNKENNITISRKKFEMGNEIEFAGHIILDTGIRPNEKKFAVIKQFPTPSCIKDVRAFLGLANQIGSFIPDLAHMTSLPCEHRSGYSTTKQRNEIGRLRS